MTIRYILMFGLGLIQGIILTDWYHQKQLVNYTLGQPKKLQKLLDKTQQDYLDTADLIKPKLIKKSKA